MSSLILVASRLTDRHPFHDEYMGHADWNLLNEYNIMGDGASLSAHVPSRR